MDEQTNEPIYRQLSNDMREGLRDIYQQITSASAQGDNPPHDTDARALFHEATAQLNEVLKSTEEATTNILEIVEKTEEDQEEASRILESLKESETAKAKIARLEAINSQLGENLVNLTLQLSFQDLTGQRIKKVVTALRKIEDTVVHLYLTSGLIMEGAKNDPKKAAHELKAEAEEAVEQFRSQRVVNSELKGPDSSISQGNIDNILAQLGL